MMSFGRRSALGVAALAAPSLMRSASAQALRGALRLVVGFPPGGSADITARLLAERLRGGFAPNVIVENRPGAAGRLAVEFVKNADPDARAGMAATLAELAAWGQGKPEIPFSSAAAGSRPHFMGVQFARATGLSMVHIPYRGSAEALPALFAGDIACSLHPLVDLVGHLDAGRLRIAAVSTPQRLARYPALPTFAEQGYPALTGSEWFGVFLPARAAPALMVALNAAVVAIAAMPEYAASVARLEMAPAPMTPAAFAARMREEHASWGPVIASSGFKPEDA